MHVLVLGASPDAITSRLIDAGHTPYTPVDVSNHGHRYAVHGVDGLSTEELTEFADDIFDAVVHSDAVVLLPDGHRRAPSFYAGAAYALNVPVLVVGGFGDAALYARRVIQVEPKNLVATLARLQSQKGDTNDHTEPNPLNQARGAADGTSGGVGPADHGVAGDGGGI